MNRYPVRASIGLLIVMLLAAAPGSGADVVTDANAKAAEIASKHPATPTAVRTMDTPMHPEYPCAHCIVSSSLGAVLTGEIGSRPSPTLSSASPTAQGAVRTWATVEDFTKEVAVARIYDGVHYRNSTEVGSAMGKKIGELAATRIPKRTP